MSNKFPSGQRLNAFCEFNLFPTIISTEGDAGLTKR